MATPQQKLIEELTMLTLKQHSTVIKQENIETIDDKNQNNFNGENNELKDAVQNNNGEMEENKESLPKCLKKKKCLIF